MRTLAALALGIALAAGALVLVDRVVGRLAGIPPRTAPLFARPHLAHPVLGYATPPEPPFPHRLQVGDDVVFDVVYYLDAYHRRRPDPPPPGPRPGRPALFFGGSFVFGEGLAYADTIPARFEALRPEYTAYNYGHRGYGPQQMLAKLEAGFDEDEIGAHAGPALAVYSYYHFHHARANGFLSFVRWAGGKHPYYELDARGAPRRAGEFATGRPLRTFLYWVLSKSAILELFRVELPPRVAPRHRALTCAIVRASRDRFLEAFPGGRFAVVVGPTSRPDDPFVDECLRAEAFLVVDTRVPRDEARAFVFEHDAHLNAAGARYVADLLAKRL